MSYPKGDPARGLETLGLLPEQVLAKDDDKSTRTFEKKDASLVSFFVCEGCEVPMPNNPEPRFLGGSGLSERQHIVVKFS